MESDMGTAGSAWLHDAGTLQILLVLAVLVAAGMFVLYRRHAARLAQVLRDHEGLTRDHVAATTRLGEAEARLSDTVAALHDHQLQLARAESLGQAQTSRISDLTDERDGLSDMVHALRSSEGDLQRQLAETRLAAQKDREAAERDIANLRELREEMSQNFKLMADEALRLQGEDLSKLHNSRLTTLLAPFHEQVKHFQTELQTRNKQTIEDGARLREQIETLHKRSEDISREAVALTRALKGDRQKQGAWGEMILERLLEESGLEKDIHYSTQETRRDEQGRSWRPDVLVKLPQKKVLVIDSKVSLLAYEEAVNSDDPDQRKAALKRHITSIRAHITGLSDKGYQDLDGSSVDYVLMFIPIEGAFSEAMREDRDLASFALERKVGLATPTTLMLTLRTVDHIWTVERRERNAMQIADRAGSLYDKLHGFVEAMSEVGQALDRAQRSHETAMGRLTSGSGNVIRQAEMLRALGARAKKRLTLDHDGMDDDLALGLDDQGGDDD